MADLGALKPKDTYQQLLTLESNEISGSLKKVQDGAGADTSLELSTNVAKVDGNLEVTGTSTLTGAVNVQGTSDFDGNVNMDGTLTLSTMPTEDTSETTALVIDANGLVKRNEIQTIASLGVLLPPTLVMRADVSGGFNLTDSYQVPNAKDILNTSTNRSYEIDALNQLSLSVVNSEGKVAVASSGVVRLDINLILNVTSSSTNIDVILRTDDDLGNTTDHQQINRTHISNNTKTAIGFSYFMHMTEGHKVYYAVKDSSGSANLLADSTFTVTKLTIE